jgi:8-oxo-dGTP diphosphatase
VPDVDLRVTVSAGGIATFTWTGVLDPEALIEALTTAANDALGVGSGLRRLEVSLPAWDTASRRAVMRAGFRLEGVRREAVPLPEGGFDDLVLFGRLVSDEVRGPTGFSGVMNAALPRKRLIAHVMMRDLDDRVLLCETQFKRDWELPGGIVEPGESPRLGAIREVREELGIQLAVGRLLVTDWLPPYLGWDDAVELIFDGGTVSQGEVERFELQPTEIKSVQLCTLPEARAQLTPLAYRRLQVAAALGPGEMAYLENGALPT